jgi:hypothetical protein
MNAKRWLILVGTAGLTAAATDCKDQSVRDYLKRQGPLHSYIDMLASAVCDLEVKHSGPALDPALRVCTNGPPDKKVVPGYPP